MITRPPQDVNARCSRKRLLVGLDLWALNAGKRWLVKAVHRALRREGLRHE
jgi:hypothetical protein